MLDRIIVPTDGSAAAWRGVVAGDRLARRCGATLELLHVFVDEADAEAVRSALEHRLGSAEIGTVSPIVTNRPMVHTVARTIAEHAAPIKGHQIVMSSSGHGRGAAFLGNVAIDVLAEHIGEVMVIGPHADAGDFDGAIVVPVDGSASSESVLSVAVDWLQRLDAAPWIVTVVTDELPRQVRAIESAYPRRVAHQLEHDTGRRVEFETLHGPHAAAAIADFAKTLDASLVLATTHGRVGLARLALGSVAAALVRHAHCPVLLAPAVSEHTAPAHRHSAGRTAADTTASESITSQSSKEY